MDSTEIFWIKQLRMVYPFRLSKDLAEPSQKYDSVFDQKVPFRRISSWEASGIKNIDTNKVSIKSFLEKQSQELFNHVPNVFNFIRVEYLHLWIKNLWKILQMS